MPMVILPSFGLILSLMSMIGYVFQQKAKTAKFWGIGLTYGVLFMAFSFYTLENAEKVSHIKNYFSNARISTNTTINLLKSCYPKLPPNSRVYFVSIPTSHILKIDLGLINMPKVIYEDTSLNAFEVNHLIDFAKQISRQPDSNFYVFEFVGNTNSNGTPDHSNGLIIDITHQFRP